MQQNNLPLKQRAPLTTKFIGLFMNKPNDIPFDHDQSQRMVPWVMGLMIFLVTLPVLCATALGDVFLQTSLKKSSHSLVLLVTSGSVILAAVIGFVAVLSIVFMSYTGLNVHRSAIHVLHLVGASNDYIARQFQQHVFEMGLKGVFIGITLTVLTILGLDFLFSNPENLGIYAQADLSFLKTLSIISLTPLIVLMLVMMAARLTVRSVLNNALQQEIQNV